MNQIGVHYAYWGNTWAVDLPERIDRAAAAGCTVMDVTPPAYMIEFNRPRMRAVRRHAEAAGVELSFCIGFPAGKDMSADDPGVRRAGIEHCKRMIEAVGYMGGRILSGILYSKWPCVYDHVLTAEDKKRAWAHGVQSVQTVAPTAADYGLDFAIEMVNRYEQYILNTVSEGLRFCDAVGCANVGLLIDVYHANIEENHIGDSIRAAGAKLQHLHISENNRRLPGTGRHIRWPDVFKALADVRYTGRIVMEPFLEPFGPVGNDIRIWRQLEPDLSLPRRDQLLAGAVEFVKRQLAAAAS